MTDLIERLRALRPITPLPWRRLPYKDGGRAHEHIDADDAYELAASNALPTLLDALEAKERELTRIANIAARLAEIARSVHIGDLERTEISALELELVKETL